MEEAWSRLTGARLKTERYLELDKKKKKKRGETSQGLHVQQKRACSAKCLW